MSVGIGTLMIVMIPLIIFASATLLLSRANGLNEDLVMEKKCTEVNPAVDLKWMSSVEKWYIPLLSKLYQYRVAEELLERDSSKISKNELDSSCVIYLKDSWTTGYNQKKKYNITSDGKSMQFMAPWSGAKSGKFSFDMTNNKNFIFGTTCWEDGQSGWVVMSTKAKLEPCDRTRILSRVQSLGFDEKLAVDESYENCDDDSSKDKKVN